MNAKTYKWLNLVYLAGFLTSIVGLFNLEISAVALCIVMTLMSLAESCVSKRLGEGSTGLRVFRYVVTAVVGGGIFLVLFETWPDLYATKSK